MEYDLKVLYSHKYSFHDIFSPPPPRLMRYDASYANVYNVCENLPGFVSWLIQHKHTNVCKVFESFGLADRIVKIDSIYDESIASQILRTIDLFLDSTSRENFISSFRKIRKEKLEIRSLLKNLYLEFSANPWDIATMSMRGISSCMSWNSSQSRSLAGSILDPYCGIISILNDTIYSGSTFEYGSGMEARAVVRLVKDAERYKLLLEKPYFANRIIDSSKSSLLVSKIFKNYLCKTGLQVLSPDQLSNNIMIPFFPSLPSIPDSVRSYRDSHIRYAT